MKIKVFFNTIMQRFVSGDKNLKISLLIFAAFYLVAIITRLIISPASIPLYLLMDAGLSGLVLWVFDLTKKRSLAEDPLKDPFFELTILFMMVFALRGIVPVIPLQWWEAGEIIRKNIVYVLPVVLLALGFRAPVQEVIILKSNFRKDAFLGVVICAALFIPLSLYSGSLKMLTNGRLSLAQLAAVLGVGFVYNIFMAALPEELFYRAFVQRRLSAGLKSPWSGLLLSALFFGIVHAAGNTSWGFGKTLLDGFAESVFVQSFIGLLLGAVYLRTRNILLCIVIHAFINAGTNIALFAARIGF